MGIISIERKCWGLFKNDVGLMNSGCSKVVVNVVSNVLKVIILR